MVSLSSVLFNQLPADSSCAICCENLQDTENAYCRLSSTLDLAGAPPKYVVHRNPNGVSYDGGIFHSFCFQRWAVTEIVVQGAPLIRCPHCCENVANLDGRRIERIFANQIIPEPILEAPHEEWGNLEILLDPIIMDRQRSILVQIGELFIAERFSDENRQNIIGWAADYNRMDVLRLVIIDRPLSDLERGLAVLRAARKGHVEVVRGLLADGALPEGFKVLALRGAIWIDSIEILQCLLVHGGPLSVRERGDLIVYAMESGQDEMARILMADGRIEFSVRQELLVDADPERRRQIAEVFKSARVMPSTFTLYLVGAVTALAASVGIASAVYEN